MTKKNFITLLLSTVGGIGLLVLAIMVIVRRKMEGKSVIVRLTAKTIGATLLSVAGTAALGFGMCLVMVWGNTVLGIVGLCLIGVAYPVFLYLL